MSIEQFPQPNQDPLKLGSQVPVDQLELAGDEKTLLNQVMVPRSHAAEQWLIDGDVLGVLELPVNPLAETDEMAPPAGEGFRIAIVDYGVDWQERQLIAGAPGLGLARSRYGLKALNYRKPTETGSVYAELSEPETTVGRVRTSIVNERLNLTDSKAHPALGAVSREHFAVRIGAAGVEIENQSRNGTKVFRAPETVYEAVEQGMEEAVGHAVEQVDEVVGEVTRDATTKTINSIGTVSLQESVAVEPAVEPVLDTATSQERERQHTIKDLEDYFLAVSQITHDTGSQEEKDMYINRKGRSFIEGLEHGGKPTTAGLLAEAITAGHIVSRDRVSSTASMLMSHFDDLLTDNKDTPAEDKQELIHLRDQFEQFVQAGAYDDRQALLVEADLMMRTDTARLFNDIQASDKVRTAWATRALYAGSVLNSTPGDESNFMRRNLDEILERSL